jgi:hypothetical protein
VHELTTTAEVEKASDILTKSGAGKGFGIPPAYGRRESMPVVSGGAGGGGGGPRQYNDYGTHYQREPRDWELTLADPRTGGGPQRHHSVSEYDGSRSHSASNVQGFYQNQRYAPRPNDADQMAQAKRRMAAQRERELRNYHQEQQYHRSKDSESGQQ